MRSRLDFRSRRFSGLLYANLRHAGTANDRATTAKLTVGEEECGAQQREEEPEEDIAGLQLTALLLVVAGAERYVIAGEAALLVDPWISTCAKVSR